MTATDVCACGHVHRLHSVLETGDCRACVCHQFTPAEDADAATEAARTRAEHRERTYRLLRRAVAAWHLDDARALIAELEATR